MEIQNFSASTIQKFVRYYLGQKYYKDLYAKRRWTLVKADIITEHVCTLTLCTQKKTQIIMINISIRRQKEEQKDQAAGVPLQEERKLSDWLNPLIITIIILFVFLHSISSISQ